MKESRLGNYIAGLNEGLRWVLKYAFFDSPAES